MKVGEPLHKYVVLSDYECKYQQRKCNFENSKFLGTLSRLDLEHDHKFLVERLRSVYSLPLSLFLFCIAQVAVFDTINFSLPPGCSYHYYSTHCDP